jgi:hypothetical protein
VPLNRSFVTDMMESNDVDCVLLLVSGAAGYGVEKGVVEVRL